ncbi:MAG: glycine/betaine transporter substrate-binding protein [Clostridia bacterium]|nr:glycine/betaine transporter substrate-binding protein [Clostridia bacterium]
MKMKVKFKALTLTGVMLLSTLALGGCQGSKSDKPTIVVGSKAFTESYLLAEVYALALEDNGFTVERKLKLGNSVVHPSLESGEIDMYPEYTGTGLVTILGQDPIFDPDEVYNIVKKEYKEKFNIEWLEHSNVNDVQAIAITKAASDRLGGITTLSEAWAHASELAFASDGEFMEREDALPAAMKTYGEVKFKSSEIVDHALSFQIALSGDADMIGVYSTEGNLRGEDFVTLIDDKFAWPPYYLTPVIRGEVLEANPIAAEVLNKVSATFTDVIVVDLNAKVDIDKEEFEDVAKAYYETIKDQVKS